MKKTREFWNCDRYVFDFKLCTVKDGWAQIDTSQDAPYYGTWANPFQLKIINYAEGDICTTEYENDEEFSSALNDLQIWNKKEGWGFKIDPGSGKHGAMIRNRFKYLEFEDEMYPFPN